MNTEINILKDGKWVALDLYEDAGVAMNYSVNDLGEFEERAGDYSREVSLPRSARNMVLLGIPLLPYGTGDTPYKAYECEVLEGGVPIVEIGAKLEIISLEDDSISVQIVGNAIDLADTLENTEMASEEGDGFWVDWNVKSIQEVHNVGNGEISLRWVGLPMGKDPYDPANPANIPAEFITTAARVYPFMRFYRLIEWILKEAGWALELEGVADKEWGDVDSILNCMWVGCYGVKGEAAKSAGTATVSASFYAVADNAGGRYTTQPSWSNVKRNPNSFFSYRMNAWDALFFALSDGTLSVKVDAYVTVPSSGGGNYQCVINVGGQSLSVDESGVQRQFDIEVKAGDYVGIGISLDSIFQNEAQWVSINMNMEAAMPLSLETLNEEGVGDEPVVGVKYDLLQCLGFDNRLEPVQEWMRLLGLTLHLDNRTKTAYMYTMGAVYDKANETQAYDWSNKLVKGDRSFTFAPDDYAKKNTMKFAENEDAGYTDEYVFNIENDSLEKEKDIFESKFLSILLSRVVIPLYDYDDDGNVSYNSLDKPVLMGMDSEVNTIDVEITDDNETYEVELYSPKVIQMEWFGRNMYDRWIAMLQEWRGVEAVFALTAIDLNKIDLSKPVWIEEFGHYYYIRSIDNFMAGQLTTVQLVKIK